MPNATDPLADLHDIHLPSDPGWWPPAPGWWLLAIITLLALIGLIYWIVRKVKRGRLKRLSRRLLRAIDRHPKASELPAVVFEISGLLRRCAIASYRREEVAGLCGNEWLQFLDRTLDTREFSSGIGRCLTGVPYQRTGEGNVDELCSLADRWLSRNV